MLQIRPEQVHTLLDHRLDDEQAQAFIGEIVAWARDAYWEMMLGRRPDDVVRMVRSIVLRALDHGIVRLDHVRDFVALDLAHGPEIEAKSYYAKRTLEDARLPAGAKLALIRQRLDGR